MAYVVTSKCIGNLDQSCVEVCPVDCFYYNPDSALNDKAGSPANGKPGMLVIDPDGCINCGACETECPYEAIHEDSAVPEDEADYAKVNEDYCLSLTDDQRDERNITTKGEAAA